MFFAPYGQYIIHVDLSYPLVVQNHMTSYPDFTNIRVKDILEKHSISLNEYLLSCEISATYLTDPEEIWNILKSHILTGMNLSIPKVKLRVCKFPAWFTPQLRHLIKCLRTLQCKYTKQPTTINFQKLVRIQSSFLDASKAAKSNYEQGLIHNFAANQDPRIYKHIKQFTKSHTLPPQLHLTIRQPVPTTIKLNFSINTFSQFLLNVLLQNRILKI